MSSVNMMFREAGAATWIPAPTKGQLINLMRISMEFEAATSERRDQLNWTRAVSLGAVHNAFERRSHQDALRLIQHVWRYRRPFGLYLRSFSLGATAGGTHPGTTVFPEEPLTTTSTLLSTVDLRCQHVLLETLGSRIPVLRIDNPALELGPSGAMMGLSIEGDRWLQVVPSLVQAADRILLLYGGPSPGVMSELQWIRQHRRERATMAFVPKDVQGHAELGCIARVTWNNDDPEAAKASVRAALDRVPKSASSSRTWPDCPELPAPAPSNELRSSADEMGVLFFRKGRVFQQGRDMIAAAEAFMQSVIMAFWSDNERGRAASFLELARSQALAGYGASLAGPNYGRAADLYAKFKDSAAVGLLRSALIEHIALALEAGDRDTACQRMAVADAHALVIPADLRKACLS